MSKLKLLVIVCLALLFGCDVENSSVQRGEARNFHLVIEPPIARTFSNQLLRAYNPNNLRLDVQIDGRIQRDWMTGPIGLKARLTAIRFN